MTTRSDHPLYWLKVGLLSAWFALTSIWAIIWYLGYRLSENSVPSLIMSMAKDLSVPELIAVVALLPLAVLGVGSFIFRLATRSLSGHGHSAPAEML